ncbi:hypothetical protein [Nocardioides marmoribigeumensis]|uniref:Uncharacterized protein n=1 Tax=Nocardioides marmoribigeumensis TaxID=433649 RepID=A0ABU2BSF8_9ACTN|nr:hypothetical protein [Nocardioides marmoribigeumensis]MDR7361196.1 hypothetical protein [Nocardioides marmoribigeumensis]
MTDPPEPARRAGLLGALRAEVGLLRQEHQRRLFAPRLALGELGSRGPGTVLSGPIAPWQGDPWPPPAWLDAGLRFDVVDRLLGHPRVPRDGTAHVWLLRPGHPVLHDEDRAWLAATRHACSAHDLATAGFWVVTRYGWLDPVSGDSRTWKRLRIAR